MLKLEASQDTSKNYAARYPLGERNHLLKGILLEVGTANSVRISKGDSADGPIFDALTSDMARKAGFHQGSAEGPNEFVYVGGGKGPIDAIEAIMQSPEMQKFAEGRAEAIAKKEADRDAEIAAQNERAWEARKAREASEQAEIAAIKEKLQN